MSNTAEGVKSQLEATEIALRPQRRGRAKLPGVPDSVIWIRPQDLPVPECLPLLFELENKGNFSNADRDATEFGKRHADSYRSDEDPYEYTIKWPTVASPRSMTYTVPVEYELLGMSTSAVVTANRDVSERQFHKGIREYYRDTDKAVQTTDVRIRTFDDTEVVFWHLEVNIFGSYTRTMILPFIISFGSNFDDIVRERFPSISLPMGVCVGGDGSDRTKTITQETGVEFPPLPNIYH